MTPHIKGYALRIPVELYDELQALSASVDSSVNYLIVHSVKHFLRLEGVTSLHEMQGTVHTNSALEEVEDLKRRLERLERLAEMQGAI